MCRFVSQELAHRIAFSFVTGIGPARMRQLEAGFDSLAAAWRADETALRRAGLDRASIAQLGEERAKLDPQAELERVAAQGMTALSWHDERYPRRLKEIADPPPLLYMDGDLIDRDEWSVAVVGTRRPTPYGVQITRQFSADLADAGITVVSGLARGVDGAAHETALQRGGRTVAVVAGGLDRLYPPEHKSLARRIVESKQGAILSEHPLGRRPRAENFPRRNRILAGMTLGTLVTEASRKSGTWHTVNSALDQNREVFAVPGPITSKQSEGANHIIQSSHGKLVVSVDDILSELNLEQAERQIELSAALPEDPTEAKLLGLLGAEPTYINDLARAAQMPVHEASAALTMLELKGLVDTVAEMTYVRTR